MRISEMSYAIAWVEPNLARLAAQRTLGPSHHQISDPGALD